MPSSPEAENLRKFGEIPVNLFTGVPDITIPIDEIKGKEKSLPIFLQYDASGVKVNDIASWVGLSWNLNAGGVVTKNVLGKPDYKIVTNNNYSSLTSNINDNYNILQTLFNVTLKEGNSYTPSLINSFSIFLKNYLSGIKDIELDYYTINICDGFTASFYIHPSTKKIHFLEDTGAIGSFNLMNAPGQDISEFIFTTADGTKYYFTLPEITKIEYNNFNDEILQYHSAWYLTKIESSSKKDSYVFEYNVSGWWTNPQNIGSNDNWGDWLGGGQSSDQIVVRGTSPIASTYLVKQPYLSSIKHNDKIIATFGLQTLERSDLKGRYALDKIVTPKNQIEFQYSHFGNPNSNNEKDKRLKLDNVLFKTNLLPSSIIEKFSFDYESSNLLPPRQSFSQDYWGYYNGKTNNTLVPRVRKNSTEFYEGANRNVEEGSSKIGILKKIIHPTKGETEFYYEANRLKTPIKLFENNISTIVEVQIGSIFGGQDIIDEYEFLQCDDEISYAPKSQIFKFYLSADDVANAIKFKAITSSSSNPNYSVSRILIGKCYSYTSGGKCKPSSDGAKYCTMQLESLINKSASFTEVRNGLTPGWYYALLMNNDPNTNLILSYEKTDINHYNEEENKVGGLRIHKIVNRTIDTNKTHEKYYYYDDIQKESNLSSDLLILGNTSGEAHYMPAFHKIEYRDYKKIHPSQCNSTVSYSFLQRYASPGNPNLFGLPNIGYTYVTELSYNDNQFKGYTVNKFYNPIGLNTMPNYNAPLIKNNFLIGKLVEKKSFDGNRKQLTSEENQYNINYNNLSTANSTYFNQSDHISLNTHAIVTDINPNSSIFKRTFFASNSGACEEAYPTSSIVFNEYSPIPQTTSFHPISSYRSWTTQLIQKKMKDYFYETNNNIPKIMNTRLQYEYDAVYPFLVKKILTTNPDLSQIEENVLYAHNKNYQDLVNKNFISIPLERSTVKKKDSLDIEKLISKVETMYNVDLLPISIRTYNLENNSNFDVKLTYDLYDVKGNLLQFTTKEDISTAIIWGYSKTQPIAKIEGATYAQVQTLISSIEPLSNLDETYAPGSDESALLNALDTFRRNPALANFQVTTYTYDPLIGVRSITPPSGIREYYFYDSANRLEFIKTKDDAGNFKILKEFKYNYKQ